MISLAYILIGIVRMLHIAYELGMIDKNYHDEKLIKKMRDKFSGSPLPPQVLNIVILIALPIAAILWPIDLVGYVAKKIKGEK